MLNQKRKVNVEQPYVIVIKVGGIKRRKYDTPWHLSVLAMKFGKANLLSVSCPPPPPAPPLPIPPLPPPPPHAHLFSYPAVSISRWSFLIRCVQLLFTFALGSKQSIQAFPLFRSCNEIALLIECKTRNIRFSIPNFLMSKTAFHPTLFRNIQYLLNTQSLMIV